MRRLPLPLLLLLAALTGFGGWLVAAAIAHVWADHTRLHQIWELEVQRAQQAQAQQQQGPPPPPAPAGGS